MRDLTKAELERMCGNHRMICAVEENPMLELEKQINETGLKYPSITKWFSAVLWADEFDYVKDEQKENILRAFVLAIRALDETNNL